MNTLTSAAFVLAFSVCAPAAVYANDSAQQMSKHHVYHRVQSAIPSTATALSPTLLRAPNSDGLSRNHEDCNRGCIDN
jgi:hypothetical protein